MPLLTPSPAHQLLMAAFMYRFHRNSAGLEQAPLGTGHGLLEIPLIETLDNMATIKALLLAAREHTTEVNR